MLDPALNAMKESPIFCGLDESDLDELVASGRRSIVSPGTCLIHEGEPGQSLLVILSGEVEVVRDTGGSEASLARFGPGSFVGEMALIDNAPRSATVRALTDAEVLEITRDQFDRLLDESPDACRNLLRTILRRLKSTEAMMVNQEKLAGLGRISAGLAHELNNPASAVSRFADQLNQSIRAWESATAELLANEDREYVERFLLNRLNEDARGTEQGRSAIEQLDLEDELARYLEAVGIESPWDAATSLATAGWTPSDLNELESTTSSAGFVPALAWLSADASIRITLEELRTSAERLSEIVRSVKGYAHMDRAPRERLDVNRGLRDTLTMLRYRMKTIELELDLSEELPEIEGYPGELNQVWTNLLVNAIDAMDNTGRLSVQTSHEDGEILVRITDSGIGIPEDLRNRLFEPFFTTKDVGVGTGLGLHISHNIVADHHGGRIKVESRPGRTEFTVCLPVEGLDTNTASNSADDQRP